MLNVGNPTVSLSPSRNNLVPISKFKPLKMPESLRLPRKPAMLSSIDSKEGQRLKLKELLTAEMPAA